MDHRKNDHRFLAIRAWFSRSLPYLLIAGITLWVFGQARSNEFLYWDDYPLIVDNPNLNPVDWPGFVRIWTNLSEGFYRPLVPTLFGTVTLFKTAAHPVALAASVPPSTFHSLQLLVHLATTLVVFALLSNIFQRRAAAFFGSLLFAVHPIQVEAAAWISQTSYTLSGFFGFTAMLAYLRATQPRPYGNGGTRDFDSRQTISRVWLVVATALYLLAILANPIAIQVPFMLAAIDVGFFRRPWRSVAGLLWPWFFCAAVVVLLAHLKLHQPAYPTASFWARPFFVYDTLAYQCFHLFNPSLCAPDYGRTTTDIFQKGTLYWTWFFPAVAFALASGLNHRRVWFTLLIVALISLFPKIVLMPYDPAEPSWLADRYAYMWMFAPALALTFGLSLLPRFLCFVAATAWIAVLAIISHNDVSLFRNEQTFVVHALHSNAQSAKGYRTVAKVLALAEENDEAIWHLRWALNLEPWNAEAHHDLAEILFNEGDYADSLEHGRKAIELRPEVPRFLNTLAWCLATCPDSEFRNGPKAVELAQKACEESRWREPTFIDTLAAAYAETGQFELAMETVQLAIAELRQENKKPAFQQRLELYRDARPFVSYSNAED